MSTSGSLHIDEHVAGRSWNWLAPLQMVVVATSVRIKTRCMLWYSYLSHHLGLPGLRIAVPALSPRCSASNPICSSFLLLYLGRWDRMAHVCGPLPCTCELLTEPQAAALRQGQPSLLRPCEAWPTRWKITPCYSTLQMNTFYNKLLRKPEPNEKCISLQSRGPQISFLLRQTDIPQVS